MTKTITKKLVYMLGTFTVPIIITSTVISCGTPLAPENFIISPFNIKIEIKYNTNGKPILNKALIKDIPNTKHTILVKTKTMSDFKAYVSGTKVSNGDTFKVVYTPKDKYSFADSKVKEFKTNKIISGIIKEKFRAWLVQHKVIVPTSTTTISEIQNNHFGDILKGLGNAPVGEEEYKEAFIASQPDASITLEEIFESFDFIKNNPGKLDLLKFLNNITHNKETFKKFEAGFKFDKLEINTFFNYVINSKIPFSQKTDFLLKWVANNLHNKTFEPLLGALADSAKGTKGDIGNFGIVIESLKTGNIFSLKESELENLFMFIRKYIFFDIDGTKTISDINIKTIATQVQKLGQTGIKSISPVEAKKIAQVIVDVFKLSDKKIPEYAGIISNILNIGVNKLTEADLVKLVPMFYFDMRKALKFDEKIMTPERVANIIYKFLHGWGDNNKAEFVKDISELVPAIAKVNISFAGAVEVNIERITELLYDGKWTITGMSVFSLAPTFGINGLPDEYAKIFSNIFKNGFLNTTADLPKLIKGLTTLVGEVANSSIVSVKSIYEILQHINKIQNITELLDKFLNKPIFDLKEKDFRILLSVVDSLGKLDGVITEKDPIKRKVILDSSAKIINKLWSAPATLDAKDMEVINNLLKKTRLVSIQNHMTIDKDEIFLKLLIKLFAKTK